MRHVFVAFAGKPQRVIAEADRRVFRRFIRRAAAWQAFDHRVTRMPIVRVQSVPHMQRSPNPECLTAKTNDVRFFCDTGGLLSGRN